jgi:CRP-like cAMP-binding protein
MATTTDRGRKLLENSPIFAALDEHGRREFVARAQPRRFAAGAAICRVGEPGCSMMAVITGTVRGNWSTQ